MISQVKVAIKYYIIVALFILNLSAKSDSNYQKYGIAFFTSIEGDSVSLKTNKKTSTIELHDTVIIESESLLSTGNQDYVFFKLSNNTAFGLFENTQFKIQSFEQEPFLEKDIQFDREPSKSNFKGYLSKGTIVVKTNLLSPLSDFEIILPNGKLELYSAICVISYRFNILHIALYEGNISLKINDSITHINSPNYYVNDAYNLKNSISNYSSKLSKAPAKWKLFKDYISVENNRVVFLPETTASKNVAKAELIISEDFHTQGFRRPRSFIKFKK